VTEPKRSQNPKRPLSFLLFPNGCSIFENALEKEHGAAPGFLPKTPTHFPAKPGERSEYQTSVSALPEQTPMKT
jgi:hypothetical protein